MYAAFRSEERVISAKACVWYLTPQKTIVFCVKHEERIPTRCNNIDDLLSIPDVIIDYSLDMFRASLCP